MLRKAPLVREKVVSGNWFEREAFLLVHVSANHFAHFSVSCCNHIPSIRFTG